MGTEGATDRGRTLWAKCYSLLTTPSNETQQLEWKLFAGRPNSKLRADPEDGAGGPVRTEDTVPHMFVKRRVGGPETTAHAETAPPQTPPESGSLPTLPTLINLCCVPIVCNQLNIKTNNVNEWSCSFPCPFISHLTSPLVSRKSLVFPGFIIGSSETQLTECFVDYEAPLSILPPLILITILW